MHRATEIRAASEKGDLMTRRMTNDEFLVLANARHGDKYCYDKSVYEISSRNIVITCKKHGDFNQSPNSHLAGRGCRKCGMVTKVEGRRKKKNN
jgi:hypothetical protein